ncbi:hypothetical protein CHARACLAT_011329 [Characodon lateralis]|uniref:Uncharacterized protein n=1 Tax=Characodon lateralis TaxID=208331 RepID=A0ABU7E980_9TELE|nr:hypothetical protein [Characodon lateralis]
MHFVHQAVKKAKRAPQKAGLRLSSERTDSCSECFFKLFKERGGEGHGQNRLRRHQNSFNLATQTQLDFNSKHGWPI